ncbi:DUF899 family protein [Bacillus subtilis]|nr:DUF899 family protein [Bacillus subtilis]
MNETASSDLPLKIVDRGSWITSLAEVTAQEKAHTRTGDALAALRRRLPVTPVGEATLIGPEGRIPFTKAFAGRRLLIAYTFMWNHGRPASEQCMGCTFSVSQLPPQTYFSERDVTLAVMSEGSWPELASYRQFMGWTQPWYSTSAAYDNPAVAGEKFLRCYVRDGDDAYLTYETTDRGTEVMDPILGLLDRTVFGRQETWEDSPAGWPQTTTGAWWRRDGRPVAQLERLTYPAAHRH